MTSSDVPPAGEAAPGGAPPFAGPGAGRSAAGESAAGKAAASRPRPFRILVNLRAIGVSYGWFRDQSLRLEAAGYDGVAIWDHFVSRGNRRDPVLESWTTLAALAGSTSRLRLMTFVMNVMNRPPSVVARMAATLQEASGGRLVLGIGIGGHSAEHLAYGIPFPEAPERVARLEEAVAVLRALWTGGPVSRESPYYPLTDAYAFPIPEPPPVIVGGESATGAALAGRIGDGWTVPAGLLAEHLPTYLDALAGVGRARSTTSILAAFDLGKDDSLEGSPWVADPAGTASRWRAAGADGAVIGARTSADVDRLVEAAPGL
jgi:alkanesulfonate monooxygenase SsuD/methylene tetrahydromethanopterin reductase-like flavin-dependent oxidoreductase (luciferase family)